MSKIWTIAWKETYSTFTNTSLLMIMIAAPLILSTIIGLAFGGDDGPAANFGDIPVAVVNLDAGTDTANDGATLLAILQDDDGDSNADTQPDCPLTVNATDSDTQETQTFSLSELFSVTELNDPDAARQAVDNGDYDAVIIVPENFSAALAPDVSGAATGSAESSALTGLEVYGNSGSALTASIVRSVVESITNQLQGANIAVSATVNTIITSNPTAAQAMQDNADTNAVFACGFTGDLSAVSINSVPVQQTQTLPLTAQLLVAFGAAQAVFFAMFSGQFGVISIIEDRREGVLQRMLVSPTPRLYILAGKLFGTFVVTLFQITILLLALMLVASVMSGEFLAIWGTNIPAIVAVVVILALCVSGLGVLMAGIARTPEQMNSIGSIVNIILAVAGGAFFAPLPSPIRETSLIYWGVDAFNTLSEGGSDILLNLAVLSAMTGVFFVVGLFLFNRRVEL